MHFEAMVAVGGAEGGGAFEAESVDVSDQGMRLRTAYLPEIGEQLVCRFDGPDGEVVAVGEVLWATEQQKGGEFGLRFVDLDPETEQALKALSLADEAAPQEEPKPAVNKGARVRLHIEGLASPMKARVRDADSKEICVGSSLEFLKLGRTVAVEDVDAGERREGFVDGVKVEVDPATSVPQLVVSLRFDAAEVGLGLARVGQPSKAAEADLEPAPVTKVAGTPSAKRIAADADEAKPSKRESTRAPQSKAVVAAADAETSDDEASDDDMMLPPNKLRAAQDRAKQLTTKAAASIGPAFSKMGSGARGFLASISGTIARRRQTRDEVKKANQPKRVTAPPPSGALTSEGRRVVRDSGKDEEEEVAVAPQKKSKKGMMVGAAAGLALVIGIVGVSKGLSGKSEPQAQKPAVSADAKNAAQLPPIPGAPATADIPLFGPTPLSTTVQVPKAPAAAAGAQKGSEPSDDEGDDGGSEKAELVREWGQGELKNSKTLKVKMDGPVEGFTAKEVDGGFTLTIPKRKSLSTSSALVRKDKRLAAVDVVNSQDGVEITVKFKGDAPGFKAKAREDKIEISLSGGSADKTKTADAKKSDKKGDGKKVAKATKKKPQAKKPPVD